jgi:protein phosphatase
MRALDGRDADPEYSVRQALPGDRYLICSDGLSGVVSDETIAATLQEYSDPNQCAERLVQLALRGGGPDNITVIIADVTDEDILEETPVVGGAAADDRGMTSSADNSTPAARASALTQPRDASPASGNGGGPKETDQDAPRRHPIRTALILVVLAGLLGGGLWLGWRYTQSKYYVGVTDDGTVAVFQGIPGKIAGFDLSTIDYKSQTKISDLTPVAQQRVKEGIPSASQAEAREQLSSLLDPGNRNVLPLCHTPTPTPAVTASPSGSARSGNPSAAATVPEAPASPAPSGPPDCRPASN